VKGGVRDWQSVVLTVVFKGEDPGWRNVADTIGPIALSKRLMKY
jgi:hypothetical protein